MKNYNDLSDVELLSEYSGMCVEMEETDYGSYSYDCLNADMEYLYSVLSKRGLV